MPGIVIGQLVQPSKLERAKELRRAMTEAEAYLWDHLRANRLNGLRFRRQQVVDGFIVDFYCNACQLIIEVDGAIHDRQCEEDRYREYVLTGRGLTILRFTNDEILNNILAVLARIETTAQQRVTPPF